MLTRIVKLTFKNEYIADFEQLFEETKQYIESYEGCISLELLQDLENPNVFFTYSKWNNPADLEKYRNSDFFNGVWSRTKLFFSEKPKAWSVQEKYASTK